MNKGSNNDLDVVLYTLPTGSRDHPVQPQEDSEAC